MARTSTGDALPPGTILSGKHRIERMLGQGSSGIVFEAIDLRTLTSVAVKLMSPERAHDTETRKRFVREARAAGSLSSPHITKVLEVGELARGTPYLVMEYLVGSTLEQTLLRDGPPPIDVALDWVLQALDGLAEAHRAGLVHRDLKPENLFLHAPIGKAPIVKVLDFGAVKDLTSKATRLTHNGATVGSPAYMSPEQIRAETVDQRADVWAMGVTVFELLTGDLPFDSASVPQALAAILRDHPTPLRMRRPEAPLELEALIACALSKDPAGRYASAAEMLGALRRVRGKLPQTSAVTKTLYFGPNNRPSVLDAFSDKTDPKQYAHEADASRVRPRIAVSERATPAAPAKDASFWPMLGAAAVTILVLSLGGWLVLSRWSPALRRSAPPASTQHARPLPSSPAAASAPPR